MACVARRFRHLANKALGIAALSYAARPYVQIVIAPGHCHNCFPGLQRSDGALV
jgi:hypothetical protein